MKKITVLLLFISSFLNADYLLTIIKNNNSLTSECIKYYDFSNNKLYYVTSTNSQKNINLNTIQSYTIQSGYFSDLADSNTCKIVTSKLSSFTLTNESLNIHNLSSLGLSNEDLNFMFALSGILISFLFLYGLFRWI